MNIYIYYKYNYNGEESRRRFEIYVYITFSIRYSSDEKNCLRRTCEHIALFFKSLLGVILMAKRRKVCPLLPSHEQNACPLTIGLFIGLKNVQVVHNKFTELLIFIL